MILEFLCKFPRKKLAVNGQKIKTYSKRRFTNSGRSNSPDIQVDKASDTFEVLRVLMCCAKSPGGQAEYKNGRAENIKNCVPALKCHSNITSQTVIYL